MRSIFLFFVSSLCVAVTTNVFAATKKLFINDVAIEVDSMELTKEQKELISILYKTRPNLTPKLASLIISQQSHGSTKALTQMKKFLSLVTSQDPASLQNGIESALFRLNPHALAYNKDKVNVFDILNENAIQCFSGSYLYVIAAQKNLRSFQPFLIFRYGHVMPGYISTDNHGATHLYGVETTVEGEHTIDYGPTTNVLGSDVVPVDTAFAFASDLLRGRINNAQDFRAQAIAQTAKRLGLNLNSEVMSNYANSQLPNALSPLNQSLFAFGICDRHFQAVSPATRNTRCTDDSRFRFGSINSRVNKYRTL